jgi:transcription initiation factor TFIIIB Brf1 subunit/transcription initiation factor TFIIB
MAKENCDVEHKERAADILPFVGVHVISSGRKRVGRSFAALYLAAVGILSRITSAH